MPCHPWRSCSARGGGIPKLFFPSLIFFWGDVSMYGVGVSAYDDQPLWQASRQNTKSPLEGCLNPRNPPPPPGLPRVHLTRFHCILLTVSALSQPNSLDTLTATRGTMVLAANTMEVITNSSTVHSHLSELDVKEQSQQFDRSLYFKSIKYKIQTKLNTYMYTHQKHPLWM